MGLDMYLYLEKYESIGVCDKPTQKELESFYPKELKEHAKWFIENDFSFLSKSTQYKVGYWRKANAIHKWIVSNFAEEDNCEDIYLEKENLVSLLDLCIKVRDNHSLASELLPTGRGFFFGSTEYDEWYFKDIDYTIELLNRVIEILNKPGNKFQIVYRASW